MVNWASRVLGTGLRYLAVRPNPVGEKFRAAEHCALSSFPTSLRPCFTRSASSMPANINPRSIFRFKSHRILIEFRKSSFEVFVARNMRDPSLGHQEWTH